MMHGLVGNVILLSNTPKQQTNIWSRHKYRYQNIERNNITIKNKAPDQRGWVLFYCNQRRTGEKMTTYQILSLCGCSSIVSAVLGFCISKIVTYKKENDALKKGIQALLRAQMISDYNKWSAKGYAPIYARQNFQNVWDNYHNLGANGVMDDIKDKFMALPTPPDGVIN